MITVEKTNADSRVIIPKDAVPLDQLNVFLDWLRFEEISQRSVLKETEANYLAEETKSHWWTANKDKFIPPTDR